MSAQSTLKTVVLMSPDKKGAIELSNTPPHENEDICGCIIAYWLNYVNKKRTPSSRAWMVCQSLSCMPSQIVLNVKEHYAADTKTNPQLPQSPTNDHHPLLPRPLQPKGLRQSHKQELSLKMYEPCFMVLHFVFYSLSCLNVI